MGGGLFVLGWLADEPGAVDAELGRRPRLEPAHADRPAAAQAGAVAAVVDPGKRALGCCKAFDRLVAESEDA